MTTPSITTDEVISNFLGAVADEMLVGLMRSAYSPNIKERGDCSASVFTAEGETIAVASASPLHLGALNGLVETIGARATRGGLRDGDVYVGNDPYVCGGTHLNDIAVVMPLFHEGQLIAFIANLAHHADVGGRTPGSESGDNTSIFQDGLRLPVMKLIDGEHVRDDIVDVICLNSRTPDERVGDLRAQLAALHVGRLRFRELVERYGLAQVHGSMSALLQATEARVRAVIQALPDGEYFAEDFIDDDGFGSDPVRLAVTVTVAADEIEFDFSGSAAQVGSGKNVSPGGLPATLYYAFKAMIDPSLPNNAGYFRAVKITCPEGNILRPRAPAAVGSRAQTAQVLADVIFGALSQVKPTRAAARSGPAPGVILSGLHPHTGRFFVDYENFAGGSGARADKDGADCVQIHITNTANLPIEVFEQEFPMVVERFELVTDSGGPGEFRGGLGIRRDIRMQTGDIRLALRSVRQRVPANGIQEGRAGSLGAFFLLRDGSEQRLPSTASEIRLNPGDVLSIRSPGGGGLGEPRSRARELVGRDLAEGRISAAAAAEIYGIAHRR